MTGVYKITNPEGKIYIGASIKVERRFKEYRANIYHSKILIKSFDLHGPENHSFEIVEECEPNVLYKREYFWIKKLNSVHPNGLNSNSGAKKNNRYKDGYNKPCDKRSISMQVSLSLFNKIKTCSEDDNRTISGFLVRHLEETLPKEK